MELAASIRGRVSAGERVHGAWTVSADAPFLAAVSAAGFDYVVIDLQHGCAHEAQLPGLCSAVLSGGATPLVRARSKSFADIGRSLDLGALGVIVPNVDNAEEARAVIASVRYPPTGVRSSGRLHLDVLEPLCVVMVESRSAVEALSETLGTARPDAIYVGPDDLSRSLGCRPDYTDPPFRSAVEEIIGQCQRAGVAVGVHDPLGERASAHAAAGCTLINRFSDLTAITRVASLAAGELEEC
jgi:4-hydroxy-2-oxoheptanedioate aldolase